MKKRYCIAMLVLATGGFIAPAIADDGVFDVPQLDKKNPVHPQKVDESALAAQVQEKANQDYQAKIMSDTQMNDLARAQAIAGQQQAGGGGNVATIVQEGSNNKSTITQTGKSNYVNQQQNGSSNDMFIQQQGDNNHTVQKQTGTHNHRVIIQNGERTETGESPAPEKDQQPTE